MQVTIKELENYLANNYKNAKNEQGLFIKLVEEIGEVAEIINKKCGNKLNDETDLQSKLGEELADVIHYAFAIAGINQLDLNQIILEKDKNASIKYHHDLNLEEFINQNKR